MGLVAKVLDPANVVLSDLCNALDDLTDQEKISELVPINVQQLYVVSKLGKIEEAETLASSIVLEEYEKSL